MSMSMYTLVFMSQHIAAAATVIDGIITKQDHMMKNRKKLLTSIAHLMQAFLVGWLNFILKSESFKCPDLFFII